MAPKRGRCVLSDGSEVQPVARRPGHLGATHKWKLVYLLPSGYDHAVDKAGAGRRLMSGSEQPSKTRIGALQDTHERLGSLCARLSILTLLVAINLALTAGVLWRLLTRS